MTTDIKEKMSPGDANALRELALRVGGRGALFVEVGCWKGYSTAILAESIPYGTVYAVDHWEGNPGTWNYEVARDNDIYAIFKANIFSLGLRDIVHPVVMDSQAASKLFEDGVMDLIFLDADHRYDYVKEDIMSWLPKLKEGGILCGHDCEEYYSRFNELAQRDIEAWKNEDCIGGVYFEGSIHPGVIKALHETLSGKYIKMPKSTIWYYVKENDAVRI
ncbi:hypothetical protein LCGC14_0369480 [marine sediment metagenome]|uniref:Methyltransferase domain-containing protein n=1 Tax=marine sediment metagenome TaxID=412755 RepID=A0A0F9TBA4_9ZZZZ